MFIQSTGIDVLHNAFRDVVALILVRVPAQPNLPELRLERAPIEVTQRVVHLEASPGDAVLPAILAMQPDAAPPACAVAGLRPEQAWAGMRGLIAIGTRRKR